MRDKYLENIEGFSTQLTSHGFELSNLSSLRKNPDALIIFGMGGSGLAGEIIARTAKDLGLRVPVFIWKNYGLPDLKNFGFKHPLYCFVSFSGNTEETVSSLKAHLKEKESAASSAVLATGGELKKIATALKLPLVSFKAGSLTPRQATGRMFYGLIEILLASRAIHRRAPNFESLRPASYKDAGLQIAKAIRGRITCIYTDASHLDLGYIWKIRLNETGKALAFSNVIPEMNHNEIVSFDKLSHPTAALFLFGQLSPRMRKRTNLTAALTKARGAKTIWLPLTGASRLEKAWRTLILSDWTAYFLAKMRRVDPSETKIVESLKARMRR